MKPHQEIYEPIPLSTTMNFFTTFKNNYQSMSQTRQLAAIMFTDIVGYTALMGNDKQKAFQLLKKNRQIQQPLIKQYNGNWIKEIGDGVLASFTRVTNAVMCAGAI